VSVFFLSFFFSLEPGPAVAGNLATQIAEPKGTLFESGSESGDVVD
jgi:hypothetical protein